MKWILSFLLIFTFTVSVSQHKPVEFPDSGASITYLITTRWVGRTSTELRTYTHVRDTIGYDKNEGKNKSIMMFQLKNKGLAYIHKDSTGRIQYGYSSNNAFYFYDMLDFSKNVGDHHTNLRGENKITRIDLTKNQGISRKRAFLNYSKEPNYIEGIGSTDGVPLFFVNGLISWAELLCFSVNDTVTYINPKYKTCDTSWYIDLAVQNPMQNRMVSAYRKSLHVDIPNGVDATEYRLLIHDVNGKLVRSLNIGNNGKQTFPMNLSEGLYLYSLLTNEKILERGKIVLN